MTAGSGAPSSSTSATTTAAVRPQTARRTGRPTGDLNDTEMTDASPPQSQSPALAGIASSSGAPAEPQIVFPRALVASIKPTVGAHVPHLDLIKKGLQYITESTIEYEEFFGGQSHKGAGLKDPPSSSSKAKKPASRSKAALAAQAEKEAFSQDPLIHNMEDALQAMLGIQQQIEAERRALDSLSSMVGTGSRLPAKSLHESFEHLIKNEVKHQQARRKEAAKFNPTPGGIESELWDMRKKVWEVHHGNESVPTSGATAGDEDEDEDMEIMVTADSGTQGLKCPITTNFFEDPVTSTLCKHSFSREAILQLIRSHVRLCPVHGCNRPITADMLESNKALARKVTRQIAIQEELSQRHDEEYTTIE